MTFYTSAVGKLLGVRALFPHILCLPSEPCLQSPNHQFKGPEVGRIGHSARDNWSVRTWLKVLVVYAKTTKLWTHPWIQSSNRNILNLQSTLLMHSRLQMNIALTSSRNTLYLHPDARPKIQRQVPSRKKSTRREEKSGKRTRRYESKRSDISGPRSCDIKHQHRKKEMIWSTVKRNEEKV